VATQLFALKSIKYHEFVLTSKDLKKDFVQIFSFQVKQDAMSKSST